MYVIGVDWAATDEAKCGLALAQADAGAVEVLELLTGREEPKVHRSYEQIARWLAAHDDALIAIDAPLGWPAALAKAVSTHSAGEPLGTMDHANEFFNRETDRHVQRTYEKTPLEVGADRIARTAFSALALIATLRKETRLPLHLAWTSSERGVIEVYPAATLKAIAGRIEPYKKPTQGAARARIVEVLTKERVKLSQKHVARAVDSDHLLDAIVCTLAGADFLSERAVKPSSAQDRLARAEGWIWVRETIRAPSL